MKRIITLTLTLVMALGLLAGCQNQEENSSSGLTGSSETSVTSSKAEASGEVEIPTSEASVSEGSREPATPAEATGDLVVPARGVWEGDVWKSDFAQLTFTLPDGWKASSDEDIAAVMNISVDFLSEQGLNFSNEMLAQSAVYDMMAIGETNDNVIIGIENPAASGGVGEVVTEEDYLNVIKEQLGAGMEGYTFGDIQSEDLGGNTYSTMEGSYETDSLSVSQKYYVRKIGSFFFFVSVSTMNGENIADITSHFSWQ